MSADGLCHGDTERRETIEDPLSDAGGKGLEAVSRGPGIHVAMAEFSCRSPLQRANRPHYGMVDPPRAESC